MILNYHAVPNIFCSIFLLTLGYFVYFRKRIKTNYAFSLLTLSAAIWQIGTSLTLLSNDSEVAFFWTKFSYMGVSLIPVTMFHFIVNLLSIKKFEKYISFAYIVAIALFIPLTWYNIFLNGVYKYPWGFWFKATLLHPIYIISYSSLFFFNLFLLYWAFKKSIGFEKERLKYLLIAFFVSYGGAIDYLPDYGMHIYPIGYIFVVTCLIIIAFAITKHHLMDIEIVIRKTAIYSILTALLTGIFLAFILLGEFFFRGVVGYSSVWIAILAAFVVSMIFQPLRDKIQGIIDRIFFKSRYEKWEILKECNLIFNKPAMGIEKLCETISCLIMKGLKLKGSSIYVINEKDDRYEKKRRKDLLNLEEC